MVFVTESYTQNLVSVSQFEKTDTAICAPPTTTGIILDVPPWFEYYSADYFNVCDTSNYVGVPQNFVGYQNAFSGRGYVGIVAYIPGTTGGECIEVSLLGTLTAGQTYYVRFYVSLGDISRYSIQNLGMLFTDTIYDPSYYTTNNISVYPQFVNTTMLTDSINWVAVTGSFVATGGEQYLTIGNFYTDAETIKQYLGGSGPLNLEAYYYIDDVYVGATPPPVGIHENENDSNFKLYPNPSNGEFKIEFKNKDKSDALLEIVDITGSLVYTQNLQLTNGMSNFKLDISNGVYFVHITNTQNHETIVKKLVIQK